MTALQLVEGSASGEVLACAEGLSFWGGVDPLTGRIIDVHHPDHGKSVTGKVLTMPTSRGSCSGSGVLLELALNGLAPAALVFSEDEETLTLGALVAGRVFDCGLPVVRLGLSDFQALGQATSADLSDGRLRAGALDLPLKAVGPDDLALSEADQARLAGAEGQAQQIAMDVLCQMAASQGATELTDVSRGHIDGCILAHDANLIFAEKLAELGAAVSIPTTINAISVDRENWEAQGELPADFGAKASRLADAYVRMGARPTFTCAPYLLPDPPAQDEAIGWSESNAVIYANTVLGARTVKHPDYLDLFIAMTGRAPLAGVYTDQGRQPRRVLRFDLPPAHDESLWAMVGWLAGRAAPDRVPLLVGLADAALGEDDLKSICASFGTTSGAPLLHIAGHTPEASAFAVEGIETVDIGEADFAAGWVELNPAVAPADLIAIGSPHASFNECRQVAEMLAGRKAEAVPMIITVGRNVVEALQREGLLSVLLDAGVRVIPDLCWCSIVEPIFPPSAQSILTNSGKYAHYAQGLSGRPVRLAGLAACVEAAVTGIAPAPPSWISPNA